MLETVGPVVVEQASSLRVRHPRETLAIVRGLAREVGIARVTDTTRLDRLGVPVFASIRPGAMPGSLCVSAGKGLRPEDAEVGAYMEAFELAHAEPERAAVERIETLARDVLDARERGVEALLDLCPRVGSRLNLDARMTCVRAEDVVSGGSTYVPAELVLLPVSSEIYWSDSNGLCSGNTILEATVHGLCEVVERDVTSFLDAADTSVRIDPSTLPPVFVELASRIGAAGFDLHVRHVPNSFRLPFFMAILRERGARDGVHLGYGCHPWRSIAVTRAITEAFQTRLTLIHGGRDDLGTHLAKFSALSEEDRLRRFHMVIDDYKSDETCVSYADVADRVEESQTLERALEMLVAEIRSIGLSRILRVVLTPTSSPLAVTRIIVPGLEFWKTGNSRLGRRLAGYLRAQRGAAAPSAP